MLAREAVDRDDSVKNGRESKLFISDRVSTSFEDGARPGGRTRKIVGSV